MRQFLIFTITLFLTTNTYSQAVTGTGALSNSGMFIETNPINNDIKNEGYTQEEITKITEKKYLTNAYNPSYVDNFKQLASLRYNLYEDQMEFVKNDNIFFLKKEIGRKVQFLMPTKALYKVFELNGNLGFFKVIVDGETSFLMKQSVRFVKHKKATSTYGVDKKADFKRRKDKFYLVMKNKDLIILPTKKKDFFDVFGENSTKIKGYTKLHKLNFRDPEDTAKIITYFNTL